MSASPAHQHSFHCLVGVDGSPLSQKAFQTALSLVQAPSSVLSLVGVVHSAEIVMAEPDEKAQLINQETQRLQGVIDGLMPIAQASHVHVKAEVLVGDPIASLLTFARSHQVDHIVVGHRRVSSLTQWLLGSVAKGVVDGASCTVTVVR